MPVNIKENYQADGWKVIKINGHNFSALNRALRQARKDKLNPYVLIANTTMGKGISFMENTEKYHGKATSRDESKKALKELGVNDDIDELIKHQSNTEYRKFVCKKPIWFVPTKIKATENQSISNALNLNVTSKTELEMSDKKPKIEKLAKQINERIE